MYSKCKLPFSLVMFSFFAVTCDLMAGESRENKPAQFSNQEIERAQADYRSLCDIWRKTEPEQGKSKEIVTDEETQRLIRELDSKHPCWFAHDFPRMAAITLGNLRVKEAAPRLIQLLQDRSQYHMVSAEAARALGKIGDRSAITALVEAIKDNRTCVRDFAGWALADISVTDAELLQFVSEKNFNEMIECLAAQKLEELEPPSAISLGPGFRAADVGSLCAWALRLKPETISENSKDRAAKIARRILASKLDAYHLRSGTIGKFCTAFEPTLHRDEVKKRGEQEKARMLEVQHELNPK